MLHEELQDRDIPHRDTIQACIMEMFQEHLTELDQVMAKVSRKIFLNNILNDIFRILLGKYQSQWIYGLILIWFPTWQSQHIGFKLSLN